MTISRSLFFRLLAHAPEELQREAKADAKRAIPALCYTEEDIRQKFAQEELWEALTHAEQISAIVALLDAESRRPKFTSDATSAIIHSQITSANGGAEAG